MRDLVIALSKAVLLLLDIVADDITTRIDFRVRARELSDEIKRNQIESE